MVIRGRNVVCFIDDYVPERRWVHRPQAFREFPTAIVCFLCASKRLD